MHPKNFKAHRLVKQTFDPIPNPQDFVAHHKDNNKSKNVLDNLEWVTSEENSSIAANDKMYKSGQEKPNSIYSNDFIEKVCEAMELNSKVRGIRTFLYNKYNIFIPQNEWKSLRSVVQNIRRGSSWKKISSKYNTKTSL